MVTLFIIYTIYDKIMTRIKMIKEVALSSMKNNK